MNNKISFEAGEDVIWDSGFGYEIAKFVGEGVSYETYAIEMKTGITKNNVISFPKSEIHKFDKDLIIEFDKHYNKQKIILI